MTLHAKRTKGHQDTLVLTFHGTGGDETQFHGAAESFFPGAHVTSPRGDVDENGQNRFFRRLGEGVYDMDDLAQRTHRMANFIQDEIAHTGAHHVVGLGYSNGANILISVMLTHPDLIQTAALMHPLIPWDPDPQPGLAMKRVLITAGQNDPICPPEKTIALAAYFSAQMADVTTAWHPGGHEIPQSEVEALRDFLI